MANPKHVEILKQGVDVWNRWREDNPEVEVDLRKADLSNSDLTMADLRDTDLSRANLSGAGLNKADFRKANLRRADLSGSDLSGANLQEANFRRANLYTANLQGANLSGANFSRTDLFRADLGEASLKFASFRYTQLIDIDLKNVKNLMDVKHRGPSYIDVNTIIRSRENIPKSFLRGVGLPDSFIECISTLTNQAFQYYSCFISYSSKDQDFAERLYDDLQNKGVRCWYAPEGNRSLSSKSFYAAIGEGAMPFLPKAMV
jgi:uncharacterized protein YjbI with pentapeptide repeats